MTCVSRACKHSAQHTMHDLILEFRSKTHGEFVPLIHQRAEIVARPIPADWSDRQKNAWHIRNVSGLPSGPSTGHSQFLYNKLFLLGASERGAKPLKMPLRPGKSEKNAGRASPPFIFGPSAFHRQSHLQDLEPMYADIPIIRWTLLQKGVTASKHSILKDLRVCFWKQLS